MLAKTIPNTPQEIETNQYITLTLIVNDMPHESQWKRREIKK